MRNPQNKRLFKLNTFASGGEEEMLLEHFSGSEGPSRFFRARFGAAKPEFLCEAKDTYWPPSERAAAIMSLIQSVRLNGHDPYIYLKNVLKRLPTHRASEIDHLLPHNWQPA